jgi:hypothetical protein
MGSQWQTGCWVVSFMSRSSPSWMVLMILVKRGLDDQGLHTWLPAVPSTQGLNEQSCHQSVVSWILCYLKGHSLLMLTPGIAVLFACRCVAQEQLFENSKVTWLSTVHFTLTPFMLGSHDKNYFPIWQTRKLSQEEPLQQGYTERGGLLEPTESSVFLAHRTGRHLGKKVFANL